MAALSGVENLVKRIYSMSEASPVNTALERQAQTMVSLYGGGLGSYSFGFIALVEMMVATLRKMSTMQVASFAEEPVLPSFPSEGVSVSPPTSRIAPVPEPVDIKLTREPSSIGAVIRRMIRRIRGRGEPVEPPPPPVGRVNVVEELVVDEGVPRGIPPRPREPVSIPEINKRVVAKVPPMYTYPTEPEEPERVITQYQTEPRQETVPPRLERPAPKITPISLPGEPLKPAPKVSQVSEMGKLVAVLAAAKQAAPPVQLETSVMEAIMETRATVRGSAAERVELSRGAASPKWSPVVIKAIGVPSAVREEPRAPASGVPEPIRATVGFPRTAETVEPTDSVMEREAESKAAQVASQMSQMSKGVAERVAEIYREGVVEKLPPAERLKGDAVSQAPALDEEKTRRVAAMAATLQKAEALQSVQKERAREMRRLPAMLELSLAGAQIAAASREAGTTFSEALRKMTDGVPKMAAAGARAAGLSATEKPPDAPTTAPMEKLMGMGAAMAQAGSIIGDSFKNMVVDLKDGLDGGRLPDKGLDGLLKDGLVGDHLPGKGLDGLMIDQLPKPELEGLLEDGLVKDHLLGDGLAKVTGDGLLESLHKLMGDRVLERVSLEGTPPVPGMRLQEVIPALTRTAAQQPSAPRRVETRTRPSFEKPKPIEVKLETSLDDIDLKELERRLARILKDEARRYGVY